VNIDASVPGLPFGNGGKLPPFFALQNGCKIFYTLYLASLLVGAVHILMASGLYDIDPI